MIKDYGEHEKFGTSPVRDSFIYLAPVVVDETTNEKVRFLSDKEWTVNLRVQNDGVETEENELRCLDCEATSHWSDLQSLDLSEPDTDLVQGMKRMQNALLWILENSNWGAA